MIKHIAKFIRRWTQCAFGAHWRIIYSSELANNLIQPGMCSDCGHITKVITWPKVPECKMPECKPAREERSNEENIGKRLAEIYENKDWHLLTFQERMLVVSLEKSGWLTPNEPPNGFAGKCNVNENV